MVSVLNCACISSIFHLSVLYPVAKRKVQTLQPAEKHRRASSSRTTTHFRSTSEILTSNNKPQGRKGNKKNNNLK